MKKVGIHGFYGMGNLGDEALLQVFLQEGRRISSAFSPAVFSWQPDLIFDDYQLPSAHVAGGIRSRIKRDILLARCRLFVLGGGGLLNDYGEDSSSVRMWLSLLRRSQKMGKRTALYCIGVDNIRYPESEALIRETLSNVDYISVRDERSADYLAGLDLNVAIHQTVDPAILLPELSVRKLRAKPKIAVCLRHWFSHGEFTKDPEQFTLVIREIAAALDKLIEQAGATIHFIPLRAVSYDDDRKVARQVYDVIRNKEGASLFDEVPAVPDFVNRLQEYDFVLSMRLHALILATASGVPGIGLEYMPKVKEYLASVGLSSFSVPMEEVSANRLTELGGRILGGYEELSKNIVRNITPLRQSVRNVMSGIFAFAE